MSDDVKVPMGHCDVPLREIEEKARRDDSETILALARIIREQRERIITYVQQISNLERRLGEVD